MKQGEKIKIEAIVMRVDGDKVHAQTPNGQLIQTNVCNVAGYSPEKAGHKAVLNAPENKSRNK